MKKLFLLLIGIPLLLLLSVFALGVIYPLPDISNREQSTAILIDPQSQLGRLFEQGQALHPEKTGVAPLFDGNDAFSSRIELAKLAEKSIDVQYYIWHDDVSGRLLLKALFDASQRGVKVRLLLDDNGIHGLDSTLTALDALDNFDVRVFNPSTIRSSKMLGYGIDFNRLNRRMHNKSFTVDGSAAIIGGRNVGDEYFKIGQGSFFVDLDVLGVGAVVPATSRAFDEYWNSGSVYDIASFVKTQGELDEFLAHASEANDSPEAAALRQSEKNSVAKLLAGEVQLEWTTVELAYDDPLKGLGKASKDQLLIDKMVNMVGEVKSSLDLVSAYFIPGKQGEAYFSGIAAAGKDVRI